MTMQGSMLAYALKLTLWLTEVLVLRLLRANPLLLIYLLCVAVRVLCDSSTPLC